MSLPVGTDVPAWIALAANAVHSSGRALLLRLTEDGSEAAHYKLAVAPGFDDGRVTPGLGRCAIVNRLSAEWLIAVRAEMARVGVAVERAATLDGVHPRADLFPAA